jgi:predicted transcriptional regulator
MTARPALLTEISQMVVSEIQLTLVITNSMGPWTKFESTVVRLKRSYENTRSVVCLTTKGRQLERNFEELKPASHVPILGTILNIFDVFVAVFFSLC